jgi:N utilization substance protein A
VRGARIRGIVEELNGERIDIVRWNDSLQLLVPNALQPAEVEDVILCPMLGKVIILVREDQLSLAIGRRGQNVRLASKLCGWDISVMTQESLDEQLDISIEAFSVVPRMPSDLVENLVSQGFFTFDDLSVIEPDELLEMSGLTQEDVDVIIEFADVESLRIEQEEREAAIARKLNPPPVDPPATSTENTTPTEGSETNADAAVTEQASAESPTEQVDGEASEGEPEVSESEGVAADASAEPEVAVAATENESENADVEATASDNEPVEDNATTVESSDAENADDKSASSVGE